MRINTENKSIDMEQRDTNFILPPYVRNYQFHNKNELPDKIIIPMFPGVNVPGADGKMHLIAIEYIAPDSAEAVEIAADGADLTEITPAQEAVLDEKEEEIKRLKEEVESLTPTGQDEMGGTTITGSQEEGLTEEEQNYEAAKADQPVLSQEELAKTPNPLDSLKLDVDKSDGVVMTPTPAETSPAKAAFAEPDTSVTLTLVPPKGTPPKPERIPKQPPGGDIGPGQPLSATHARDTRDQTRTIKDLKDEPDIKEEEEVPFEKEITRDEKGKPIVEDKPNE